MIEYYKEQQIFSMAGAIWMNGLEHEATRHEATRHEARGNKGKGGHQGLGLTLIRIIHLHSFTHNLKNA